MSRGKWVLAGLLAVVAIVILVVGIYGLQWFSAEPRGAIKARERIVGSGDYRIAAYNSFFNQCAAVQSHEGRIESLEIELETTDPSPARLAQINASLTAIRSQRLEAINEYNADASREYTSGQFRDSDLPYQLDPNDEDTECAI